VTGLGVWRGQAGGRGRRGRLGRRAGG
jgi:hypothetical protein